MNSVPLKGSRPKRSSQVNLVYIVLTFLALFFSANCKAQDSAQQIYRYASRGIIVKLPATGETKPQIQIHHEPIPDYVDESGSKVGMPAMTMYFSLAPEVSIINFKNGDTVDFILQSWWKPRPGDQIVSIKKSN